MNFPPANEGFIKLEYINILPTVSCFNIFFNLFNLQEYYQDY